MSSKRHIEGEKKLCHSLRFQATMAVNACRGEDGRVQGWDSMPWMGSACREQNGEWEWVVYGAAGDSIVSFDRITFLSVDT